MIVCFIGSHLGLPKERLHELKEILIELINLGYKTFYCGVKGGFDWQCVQTLNELKKDYPFIEIVKVKPTYQHNPYISSQKRELFFAKKKAIISDMNKDEESVDFELNRFIDWFGYDYFKDWYLEEQKYFDNIIVPDINVPPKYIIIECNKWKVRVSDVLISYCPNKNSNSWKIMKYAEKLNKKVVKL